MSGRLLATFALIAWPVMSLTAHGDDAAVIGAFHDALITAMKSGASFDERATMLDPVIKTSFDLPTIARVSLGRTWRDLDPDAQQGFTMLLGELIVATYADRFARYIDQRFETLSVDAPKPDRSVITTRLVRVNDVPVSLDYYVNGGRIYNIVADGVSDLSLRRARSCRPWAFRMTSVLLAATCWPRTSRASPQLSTTIDWAC